MRPTLLLIGCVSLFLFAGCHPKNSDALREAAKSLEQEEYDQAIAQANESLKINRTGAMAAEALYVRGRAYEQQVATSNAQLQQNLQLARMSYVDALKYAPPVPLSNYIRASLGKVAFYQDDFQTAQQQLWLAYNALQDPELRAATLFLMGKAQQRSSQFQQADASFTSLINHFGETGWAAKAREIQGKNTFYLQLAVYENPASLEAASRLVQQRGLKPVYLMDSLGRHLLQAGPYASYAIAKQARPRIADAFPDATIVP